MAYVDQGYTGPTAAEAAQSHGIRLEVVKHPMAKRGFVLLPRRWVQSSKQAGSIKIEASSGRGPGVAPATLTITAKAVEPRPSVPLSSAPA